MPSMATIAHLPLLEVESDSGETFPVENPATGETIAQVPRMGAAETRRAIERAEAAQPKWRALLAKDRARILRRWADSMLEAGLGERPALLGRGGPPELVPTSQGQPPA